MRITSGLLLFPILAAASPVFHTSPHDAVVPLIAADEGTAISDSYIIVLKKSLSRKQATQHHRWAQEVHLNSQTSRSDLKKRSLGSWITDTYTGLKHTYDISGDFLGYSGHFDLSTLDQIRRHPDVSSERPYHSYCSSGSDILAG